MIDLGRPAMHAEGVTIFPDHAEPTRFHFVPDRPRVATTVEGIPELTLLKYRLDPALHQTLGAGLLSLTIDLGVDEESRERLRRKLVAQTGSSRVTLEPVLADEGTCELILIDRATRDEPGTDGPAEAPAPETTPAAVGFGLVERLLGAAAPSLYGVNSATFAAVLSAEGVGLVEKALLGGGLPAGVVYTLRVTALRPALRAQITARWQDAYHFYENRLQGGKLLLAADIGPTVERLVHDEVVRITVDELVPEADRASVHQRALDQVQRYVLEELFEPTLGQAPPPEDGEEGALATIGSAIKDLAGFFSFTHRLRSIDRSELKTFTYQLGVAQAERMTFSPQGTLAVLVDPEAVPMDRLIVEVPPGPPASMLFDVGVLVDLEADDVDHLEVVVTYGETEERALLDSAAPRTTIPVWYRPELGPAIRYRFDVHLGTRMAGLGGVLGSDERDTEHRVIRLDPRDLFRRVEVRAVTQGVPFDRYPRILIDLRIDDPVAGWSEEQVLELGPDHPEAVLRVRAAVDAALRIRRRVRYVGVLGEEITDGWEDADVGVMVLGDPRPDVLDLQILGSARFGTSVSRLIVEVRPRSDPGRVATRILSADAPSTTWSWAMPPDGDRGYEYRVTVQTPFNEVREGRWLPGPPGGSLVVGEGIARLRDVQVLFVGSSPEELGLLALKVRFAFADQDAGLVAEDEFLVEDARTPVRWTYPVADPERQDYTFQVTLIRADGTVETQPPVTSSDLLLVYRLG